MHFRTHVAIFRAVTLGVSALAAGTLTGCGAGEATTENSVSTGTVHPVVIDYTGPGNPVGVEVNRPRQSRLLRHAGYPFKSFVAHTVRRLRAENDCPGAALGVSVQKVSTAGFAIGGVSECGGYEALWGRPAGTWRQLEGTQDEFDCRVLRRYDVPANVVGHRCVAYHGDHQEHRYP